MTAIWRQPRNGYSLLELVFAVGVATTVAGATVPPLLRALDYYRTLGAVRYLSTRLQRARMEAVSRHATMAVRFARDGESYAYAVFADGNGDGVKSADIERGVDRRTTPDERLSDHFRGVTFDVLPGVPSVDPATAGPMADPIRLGAADSVSFTPLGTATAGSLYVLGGHEHQYAITIFGETGKTRIMKFNGRKSIWEPR